MAQGKGDGGRDANRQKPELKYGEIKELEMCGAVTPARTGESQLTEKTGVNFSVLIQT